MSASTTWQSRFTPAQLEQHATITAIRKRQKEAMLANLQRQAAAQAEANAKRETEKRAKMIERSVIVSVNEMVNRAATAALQAKQSDAGALFGTRRYPNLSPKSVARTVRRVADAYGVEASEIMGASRTGRLVAARTHAMALLCIENPLHSVKSVARALNKDHTTVLHALKVYNGHFGANVRNVKPVTGRKMPTQLIELPAQEALANGGEIG